MSYIDNAAAVRALVRPTEVHKDLFIDNEIFDLEMENLFANTWVYVGHASQIPNPGDFHTTTVGNQPVEIGRASCRESGCQYVEIEGVAVSLRKKKKKKNEKAR